MATTATTVNLQSGNNARKATAISPARLIGRRFLRNRLAIGGGVVLILLYMSALFADFLAPIPYTDVYEDHVFVPPQLPRFLDEQGNFHLRPFVYGLDSRIDMDTFRWVHDEDFETIYPIYFFVEGYEYKLLGLIPFNRHLYGVDEPGVFYLLGSDDLGHDMVARVFMGARISLTIGLVGVILTIIFGASLGTISGFYGGMIDTMIQRIIEFLMSFPAIPLWAALAAAMPPTWSPFAAILCHFSNPIPYPVDRPCAPGAGQKCCPTAKWSTRWQPGPPAPPTPASSFATCCPTPSATLSSSPHWPFPA